MVRKLTALSGAVVGSAMLALGATAALGQTAGASPGQVRQEVRQLANDLQDPNYDYSKAPERIREVFRDFRSATEGMSPDDAQQFRQELFQTIGPVLQAHQQQIADAMRMSFLKGLQQPLGCSDDEFAAIRPYLEKVVEAQQATQVFRFGGPGSGIGQQGGQNGTQPGGMKLSAVQQAASDLQAAVNDPNTSEDLIRNKLDLLRQARDKAQQDLKVARAALQQLLTQRQEAVLVENGLLE
jgi:hypothetical protein